MLVSSRASSPRPFSCPRPPPPSPSPPASATPSSPPSERPTALAFTPDGRLLVTTQGGTLRVVSGGALLADAGALPRLGGLLERRARAPRHRARPAVHDEPLRLPVLHVQQERRRLPDEQHDVARGADLALHAGRPDGERDRPDDGARPPRRRPELRGQPQRRPAARRARRLPLRGHRRRRLRLRGRQRLRGRERRLARPEHPEREDRAHRAGRLRAAHEPVPGRGHGALQHGPVGAGDDLPGDVRLGLPQPVPPQLPARRRRALRERRRHRARGKRSTSCRRAATTASRAARARTRRSRRTSAARRRRTCIDPVYEYPHGTIPGTSTTGCGSITGGAWVPAGAWPAAYDGAYLFADFDCGAIVKVASLPAATASDFATGPRNLDRRRPPLRARRRPGRPSTTRRTRAADRCGGSTTP